MQPFKIDWKDGKNLVQQHPRVIDDGSDDMVAESGSFFNYFEETEDPFDVSC